MHERQHTADKRRDSKIQKKHLQINPSFFVANNYFSCLIEVLSTIA